MVESETLDNGLKVLYEKVPGVRSAALGVWLRRGSRHESARLSGICHFIEHLVFKGTENRTAREIALLSDKLGGSLDAFTTKETTCYYARVLDRHLPEAVELLGDIAMRPRFDAEELESERRVILEEIRMVKDSPEDRVYDLFCESFWPGHPLGRPIQGTEQSVGAMSRKTVLSWFRRSYAPSNMLVAVAGRVDARHRRLVAETFGSLPRGGGAPKLTKPRFRAGVATEPRKGLEQAHVMLGVPGLAAGNPRRFTLHVMNTLFGGSLSSRLFQTVREKHGLAYSVGSQVAAYENAGMFSIYAGTSSENSKRLVGLVMDEIRRLVDAPPEEDELVVAREHLKGGMLLALESTSSRMSRAAREEMILGRHMSATEIERELDSVTPDDVLDLARDLLGGRTLALAAVGNLRRSRFSEKDLAA